MRINRKGFMLFFLVLLLSALVVGCSDLTPNEETMYTPGTYEGISTGHGGEVKATVTVNADEIEMIEILAEGETGSIGEGASDQLVNEIIATQSLAVDVVSGATESSEAIIEAVTLALQEADGDIEVLEDPANKIVVESETQEDLDVDVVVIGSGGAGMSAAIEAKDAGKSVVILEKMPIIGGNTNRATGGMNAAETYVQEENGIEDSKDTYYADTLAGGYEKNDPELLRTLVDNAADTLVWINDLGADLTGVSFSGGQTNMRAHRPADGSPVGPVVVETLSTRLDEQQVDILLNTTATKIIEENGVVVGVEATDSNDNTFVVNAKAVILATGGFGANSEKVESYRSDLVGYNTTNHQGALGSGIDMALEVGASLTDIEEIQIHPTTDPETGYMFTEAIRGDGGILINKEANRFINELETRDVVSAAILEQTDATAFLISNDVIRGHNASLDKYINEGYGVQGNTLEELAEKMGVDAAAFQQTMEEYATIVENVEDPEIGRTKLSEPLVEGAWYALPVVPSIHHTMGGVTIDTETHVLNEDGEIIKGLYAAGEVTGGVHGANRLGGNAIADILTFGRIAGQTAATEVE